MSSTRLSLLGDGGGNGGCEATCGDVGMSLIFFLQIGFTLILATFDGLDVGLLEDVIGEDDCNDDDCDEEMSLSIEDNEVSLVDGVLEGAFGALGDDS
ncbi:hypothetical protein Tco_0976521 [Tanacetum coccineum]|uniref:Uncharacterized protein n=1 Tax=Tanacetum coccineum TaxID=301880 RepID=A0ABQ5EHF7_9ASTR